MELGKKILSGSLWTIIETIGLQLFGLIVLIILSQELSPRDFGVIALAIVFTELSAKVSMFGMNSIVVAYSELTDVRLNSVFYTAATFGLIFAVTLYFCAPLIGNLYESNMLTKVLQHLAILPFFSSLQVIPDALLNRAYQYKKLAMRNLITSVLSGSIAIWMALSGYGIDSLIMQKLLGGFSLLAMLWVFSPWRPSLQFSLSDARATLHESFPVMSSQILQAGSNRTKDVIIGFYLGEAAVGLLHIAFKLQDMLVKFTIEPVVRVCAPALASKQDDIDALKTLYMQLLQSSYIITIPAFVGLAILSPTLVVSTFGEEWKISATILQILGLSCVGYSIRYMFQPLMIACKKPFYIMQIQILQFVTVSISLLISVHYGLLVAISAFVLTYILSDIFSVCYSKRVTKTGLRDIASLLYQPITCSALMGGVLLIVQPYVSHIGPYVEIASLACIGIVIYLGSYRFLFPKSFALLLETLLTLTNKKKSII